MRWAIVDAGDWIEVGRCELTLMDLSAGLSRGPVRNGRGTVRVDSEDLRVDGAMEVGGVEAGCVGDEVEATDEW